MFSHCTAMGANGHRDGDLFDPRNMIGKLYVKRFITMLPTKFRSFESRGFREYF